MHGLDYTDISECTIDNKQNVLEEYILLRETIYNDLTDIEKLYRKFYGKTKCNNSF